MDLSQMKGGTEDFKNRHREDKEREVFYSKERSEADKSRKSRIQSKSPDPQKGMYQRTYSSDSSPTPSPPPMTHEISNSRLTGKLQQQGAGLEESGFEKSRGQRNATKYIQPDVAQSGSPSRVRKYVHQEEDLQRKHSTSPSQQRRPAQKEPSSSKRYSGGSESDTTRRKEHRSQSHKRRGDISSSRTAERQRKHRERKRSPSPEPHLKQSGLPSKWARHRDSTDNSEEEDRELEKAYHGGRGQRSRSTSDSGGDMFGIAKLSQEFFS